MEKIFLSYFDLLGYKNFILNNSNEIIKRYVDALFLQVELSISDGDTTKSPRGRLVANMEVSSINCLNISDTIILSTNDNSIESFKEILRVTHNLNWRLNGFLLPVRGCLTYGEIDIKSFDKNNGQGGSYRINSLAGKGLVKAYMKAESQIWAGTVVDEEVVKFVNRTNDFHSIAKEITIKYNVPYKVNSTVTQYIEEYVFRIKINLNNDEALKNTKESIIEVFNKPQNDKPLSKGQELKLNNTLRFIDYLMGK